MSRRIVLLTIEAPDPLGDAAARWYHVLLRGLVERGHDVTAVAACTRPADIDRAEALFPRGAYDLRCVLSRPRAGLRARLRSARQPLSYVFDEAVRDELAGVLAGGYDVLHLEHTWSGWLGLDHARRSLLSVHYLRSLDATRPRGLADRLRERRMLRAEARLLRSFPTISTLTPRLANAVRTVAPGAHVGVTPLALDVSLYPFEKNVAVGEPPTVTLIGSFSWGPTRLAAERLLARCWPSISAAVPDARLRLVGRDANALRPLVAGRGDVELAADVPDARPYFHDAHALLFPARCASGMKVKVLEAMALGLPVVTTTEGVEGIDARDGIEAAIANDDNGLVARTIGLLRQPARRVDMAARARRLVERTCDPDAALDRVEALHAHVAAGTGPTRREVAVA